MNNPTLKQFEYKCDCENVILFVYSKSKWLRLIMFNDLLMGAYLPYLSTRLGSVQFLRRYQPRFRRMKLKISENQLPRTTCYFCNNAVSRCDFLSIKRFGIMMLGPHTFENMRPHEMLNALPPVSIKCLPYVQSCVQVL